MLTLSSIRSLTWCPLDPVLPDPEPRPVWVGIVKKEEEIPDDCPFPRAATRNSHRSH